MLRALKDILKNEQVLIPQSVSATIATDGVDVSDFGSIMFLVNVGTFTFTPTNKISITVQHSDTDSAYADVLDADIHDAEDGANGIAKILDAAGDADSVHAIHYRGNKKFVRLNLVEGGTVVAIMGVVSVRGNSEFNPPL